MGPRFPGGFPAARLSSRVQLAVFFTGDSPSSSSRRGDGGRHGLKGPLPALTAEVRVVIRRHFPVGGPCGTRMVETVAEDIALRRRPSRALREPESVDRALAMDVLPHVRHPFDRGAVVAAGKKICAHVAAACAHPRIGHGGAHVLVLIDTMACPVVLRRPPWSNKPMMEPVVCPAPPSNKMMMKPVFCPPPSNKPKKLIVCPPPPSNESMGRGVCLSPRSFVLSKAADPILPFASTAESAEKVKRVGVIGDRRPKRMVEERFDDYLLLEK
jgi:hypothetical protein